MKWLFILITVGLVVIGFESESFACGGCPKAWAQGESGTDTSKVTKTKSKVVVKEVFQCPNCGYEQDKPGQCPMCKAELKKTKVARTYVCPRCDYSQRKPEKCPKCGIQLEEKVKPVKEK